MRFQVSVLAVLGAFSLVNGIPTNFRGTRGEGNIESCGTACVKDNYEGNCTDLAVLYPNQCMTALSHDLPLSMSIASMELKENVACAFFTLESCIMPQGTRGMVVQGPAKVPLIPGTMQNSIQAYICGENATVFAGNWTLEPGIIILQDQAGDAPWTGDSLERKRGVGRILQDQLMILKRRVQDWRRLYMGTRGRNIFETRDPEVSKGVEESRSTLCGLCQNELGRHDLCLRACREEAKGTEAMETRSDDFTPRVTLFKERDLQGPETIPQGQITLSATFCEDLDQLFGNWYNDVRSFVVHPNRKCQFFLEKQCPRHGKKLEYGTKNGFKIVGKLDRKWDQKIASVMCWDI